MVGGQRSTLEVSHSHLTVWDALSLSLEPAALTGWPLSSVIHLSPSLQHWDYCCMLLCPAYCTSAQGPNSGPHHCATHLTSWAISLVPCTPCFGLRFVLLLIMCVGGICTCECSTHMGQKRALDYLQLERQWPMSWEDPDPLQEQYVLWVVPVLLSSQAQSIPFENSSTVSLHPLIEALTY